MYNRTLILGVSIFFLLITVGLVILSLLFGPGFNFNSLITFSLFVLALSVWVVYPSLTKNDERTKFIKKKTTHYNYFIILAYLVIFFILTMLKGIDLNALLITILSAVIVSISITLVAVEKRN